MQFLIFALILFSPLVFVLLWLIKHGLELEREKQKLATEIVTKIIEQIGWENKQQWVGNDEIEFVSLIIGLIPGQHKLWARVRITKNSIRVTVEYCWDCEVFHVDLANRVAKVFEKRNISAMVKLANRQPTAEEIYAPPPAD